MKIILFLILFSNSIFSAEWETYNSNSDQALAKRDYENALKFVKMATDELTRIYGDSSKFHINQYGKYGRIYYYMGRYDEAIEYYETEKNLILKIHGQDNLAYAKAINNLSVIYSNIGRNSEIEPLLKESILLKKKIAGNMDTSYAKSLNNLGQFYYSRGKYPEAEKLLLEALKIKEEKIGKDDPSTALTMMNLGLLYEGLGNREAAIKYLEKSNEIMSKKLDINHPDRITTIYQLANLYAINGEKEKAEKLTNQTNLTNDSGEMTVEKANSIYNYVQLQIRLNKDDKAQEVLEANLPKVKAKLGNGHPLYSKMIKALGIIYWINNNLEPAYELFQENLEIARQLYGEKNIQYASALHNLAGLLKELKYYEEADSKYFEAFDIYFYQLENYFPYFSESEKTKFYRLIKERFDMFNSYVLSRYIDKPEILNNMYDYHILTKGLLLDYSKDISTKIENSGNKELLKKYNNFINIKSQLSELYSKNQMELQKSGVDINVIEEKANSIEREISMELSKLTGEENLKITWKDIQSNLKEDEAAIEIIRFNFYTKSKVDSTVYAVLILTKETTQYPKFLILENATAMDDYFLKRYKKTVKAKFPDNNSYDVYWGEIDKNISGKKNIYLSADGVFNLINVASLRKDSETFVLDDKTIINLNNTKELLKNNIEKNDNLVSFFFGSPTYELDNANKVYKMASKADKANQILISPLPGTEIEVNKIKSIFEKNNKDAIKFLNEQSSEQNFKKLRSPKILHIATHGYFLSDVSEVEGEKVFGIDIEKATQNPLLRSGLLFSGASNFLNFDASQTSEDNGILTAYEVKNMDLRGTELVVMSACETGLGEVMNGEGVYGLQRAFQVAGAKSIIMSLWTVDDKTTQELMVEFYQRYLNGMEKVQAFREARLVIRDRYQEPYYWGAFKLLGKE